LRKRKSIVPLNSVEEAFEKYSELMPAITDVRGERVNFDLGSYTHLLDDEDRLRRIGFEILDFSYFIPHLYEPGVVPQLDMRFDVQVSEPVIEPQGKVYFKSKDTQLTGVTLHEVLKWAYEEFILSKAFGLRPRLVKAHAS